MSISTPLAVAALFGSYVLATPAAAQASAQPMAASVTTLSAGRVGSSSAALVALAGVFIGVLALTRPAGRVSTALRGRGGILALVAGVIGVGVGGLVVATADGGLGTGNGLGGGIVAMALGVVAIVLGGFAVSRSRRAGSPNMYTPH